jgi:ABC-type antimicrobial peptide transport system permease subunit
MTVLGADPGLTPTYEGITNTKRITDWNPPFPMDMKRIRPKDEAYWDKYKATPKVFVSLETGLKLWAEPDPRYGRLTSIRIGPGPGLDLAVTAKRFEEELLKRLKPEDFGLKFEPVRAQALASAEGSTDFGMLVIGFSSFLIAAAAMLVALLFRLGVERRAAQIGLLQSIGWPRNKVARTLLAEGAIIAAAGTVLGLLAAIGYAWLMLAGLRTWWAAAVNAPFLHLHISGTSLAIGAAASFLIAVLSISGSIRGMTRLPPRALMAGAAQYSDTVTAVSVTQSGRVAAMCLVLAAGLALASPAFDKLPRAPAFFASGALMLAACLAALMRWMRTGRRAVIARPGRSALARLGIRNAARNRGRSLLTAGLIACASFVVVAVGANRHAVDEGDYARTGGTGGFRLIGESTAPLLFDLNRKDGRESLSLAPETAAALASASVISFRLQPGDDASCLNLYQPRKPRILGATPDMIARGGFAFSSRMADSPDEKANPWLLLNRALPDGAVPCIGDANTIQWLLHLGLGENLIISDERGNPLRLRIVAMLAGSVLQGELVIAERDFIRHFPSVSGYRFFLIEAPPDQAGKLTELLERDLSNFGLDLEPTGRRLADYLAVENTYLSAFQTLGGLGLLLGTFGLAAVMLRNLLERRGELALLRALGFRRSSLAGMVFAENMFLLTAGLVAGTVSALLAVAPHLVSTFAIIPWRSLATTLLAVMLAGAGALAAALRVALRAPLLASLRRE